MTVSSCIKPRASSPNSYNTIEQQTCLSSPAHSFTLFLSSSFHSSSSRFCSFHFLFHFHFHFHHSFRLNPTPHKHHEVLHLLHHRHPPALRSSRCLPATRRRQHLPNPINELNKKQNLPNPQPHPALQAQSRRHGPPPDHKGNQPNLQDPRQTRRRQQNKGHHSRQEKDHRRNRR